MSTLIFAKTREGARIPTKRHEDAGRDIYACFDEDYIMIRPFETRLIPTGIATSFSSKYYAQLQERGSTGSLGIKYGAGVIDSGYRGEWFVPLTNVNPIPVIIAKKEFLNENPDYILKEIHDLPIVYPYEKAIAQFVMIEVPEFDEVEISYEQLLSYESARGTGSLGSSGK